MTTKHIGLFATDSVRSMGAMNPELKPRFLREACRIIGEHPDGKDARNRLAYYDDLYVRSDGGWQFTSRELVVQWAEVLQKVSRDPQWIASTEKIGSVPRVLAPEQTAEFAKVQFETYDRLARSLGLELK